MLNHVGKYINTLAVGFFLLSYVLPCEAEPIDLDKITMSIIDDDENVDYIISIPEKEVDWGKMLELNGITQQEYESRYETFIEGQNQIYELQFPENDLYGPDILDTTEVFEE